MNIKRLDDPTIPVASTLVGLIIYGMQGGQTVKVTPTLLEGSDGVDGVNGKSAYQVAVDNGFVGTQAEWLESLKGADGASGNKIIGVSIVGDDLVYHLDEGEDITLTNGRILLRGEDGVTVSSAEFVDNDLVFTLSDNSSVIIENAKSALKGDALSFEELTEAQKNELRGEPLTFDDLTVAEKEELKGLPFTYEDFTQEQIDTLKQPAIQAADEATLARLSLTTEVEMALSDVDEALANIDDTKPKNKLSFVKENETGEMEYINEAGVITQPIYSKMIGLADLPQTANETKDYEISSEEHLGNQMYISIESVVVKEDGVITSDYSDKVKFGIIAIDNIFYVRATCIATYTEELEGSAKVSYIKYFGEKISFDIECATEADANNLELSIPPLKHNKENIIGYSFDDNKLSYYCVGFAAVNNRPIMFKHPTNNLWGAYTEAHYKADNMPPEEYLTRLNKTLGYTDGCGNERRAKLGYAIWPAYLDNEVDGYSTSQYRYMGYYLTWEDLEQPLEFGSAIQVHNVDEPNSTPAEIIERYKIFRDKALYKVGRGFKTTTRPDGNSNYVFASLDFPEHLCMAVETHKDGYSYVPYKPYDEPDMHKMLVRRIFSEDVQFYQNFIASEMAKPKEQRELINMATHNTQQDYVDSMVWINDTYGKDGTDVIWFTHLDEVYEYWYLRKYSKINKTVVGNIAHYDILIPSGQFFYYPELTFISNLAITQPSNLSDVIKGFSFNGTNMFNVNLDRGIEVLAEKYTSRYESMQKPIDKQDALYFANQLRSDLKEPFTTRVSNVDNVPLVSLSISGGDVQDLLIGETTQLAVSYNPSNTAEIGVIWSSSNDAIATVSESGLVESTGAGTVTITATSSVNSEISATKQILCVSSRPVTSITISGSESDVVGETIQLSATLSPSNTTQTGIIWSSLNESVATVNSSGLVTLISAGTVQIKAESSVNSLVYDIHQINVVAQIVPLVSISITGGGTVEATKNIQLSIAYNPTGTTQTGVTWSSSNNGIATVSQSGLVTGVSTGNVTITATSIHNSGITTTKALNVTPQVVEITGLQISGGSTVDEGSTVQLSVSYTPSNTTEQGVTWTSSDGTKATVSSTGLVTAIASGAVTITATSTHDTAISDTHEITINEVQAIPITGIMMTGAVDRRVGQTYQMPYKLTPSDTTQTGLIWESSDPSIVSIDNTGFLTPHAVGVITLTLTSASNPAVTTTKRMEVFAATTNPLVRIVALDVNQGGIITYDCAGDYGTSNHYRGIVGQPATNLIIYDAKTGNPLTSEGWSKMTQAQLEELFPNHVNGPNTAPTIPSLSAHDGYSSYILFGAYAEERRMYLGQKVPNGTYNIKVLSSSDQNPQRGVAGVTFSINGQSQQALVSLPSFGNETWYDCGDFVISDGNLTYVLYCPAKNYWGWNQIMIEKIA